MKKFVSATCQRRQIEIFFDPETIMYLIGVQFNSREKGCLIVLQGIPEEEGILVKLPIATVNQRIYDSLYIQQKLVGAV